jgi:flagellin
MATVDVTRIASNIGALNALNSLTNINKQLAIHQGRLQTGKRINSAADDPAGLTIATKMLAQSEGLKTALSNIGDANNMLSVAEGGMSKMNDILVQMRSKAEQAASDTLGSSERAAIQTQLSAYSQQIQDLVDQTKWNGVKLLDQTTGTKQFQTGVDQGETTSWALTSKLDPASMGLSTNVAQATVANPVLSTSETALAQSGVLGNATELTTGGYSFKVLDQAVSSVAGGAKVTSTGPLATDVTAVGASTTAAAELQSGHYRMIIDTVTDTTHTSYRLQNLDDSTWNGNGTMTVTAQDIHGGDILSTAGTTVGAKLTFTTNPAALVAGQTMDFEYIAHNQAKVELDDASGQAQSIAQNAGGTVVGNFAYTNMGGAYQSGRGASVTLAAQGTVVTGAKTTFDYERANPYSVDVSSAIKAGAYMTTVNSAMDKVNSAMSDLGSLMARLTFKQDAVTTAQVNVESSYSQIMNANMAEEQVNASKYSILQQTATAMLSQANQAPQSLLSLFR